MYRHLARYSGCVCEDISEITKLVSAIALARIMVVSVMLQKINFFFLVFSSRPVCPSLEHFLRGNMAYIQKKE